MLNTLGRKRIIMLLVLALLSVGLIGAWFQFLTPMRVEAESRLSSATSVLETRRGDIIRLKKEHVLLQEQISHFKAMESQGFFNDQNRVLAQDTFDKFRDVSGVLKANYTVSAGEEVPDERAERLKYMILKSPVTIEIESIDDADFYNFLKLILEKFPGRSNVSKISIQKNDALKQATLREIGAGKPVSLIKASIKYDWFSMAKKDVPVLNPAAPPPVDGAVAPPAVDMSAPQGATP